MRTSPRSSSALPPTGRNEAREQSFKECLETNDLNGEACRTAIEASGLTREEFAAKLSDKVSREKRRESAEGKNESRNEFYAALRACLATANVDSEPCARAQQLSGLSPEDFQAKIVAKFRRSAVARDPS